MDVMRSYLWNSSGCARLNTGSEAQLHLDEQVELDWEILEMWEIQCLDGHEPILNSTYGFCELAEW